MLHQQGADSRGRVNLTNNVVFGKQILSNPDVLMLQSHRAGEAEYCSKVPNKSCATKTSGRRIARTVGRVGREIYVDKNEAARGVVRRRGEFHLITWRHVTQISWV